MERFLYKFPVWYVRWVWTVLILLPTGLVLLVPEGSAAANWVGYIGFAIIGACLTIPFVVTSRHERRLERRKPSVIKSAPQEARMKAPPVSTEEDRQL